jgi:predicted nucleotidyltransferase component of viral defense system
MDRLVLKGGNLLDLIYGISTRASKDLDFSMEGEFASVEELRCKLFPALTAAYVEMGYDVFDFKVTMEPPRMTEDRKSFWGGYRVYFKLIEFAKATAFRDDESRRRHAVSISPDDSKKFRIDISKHELCDDRRRHLLNGYVIYGYSPELFVAEKLRAICQQHTTYSQTVQRHRSARARDFVDICCVLDRIGVDIASNAFRGLVGKVFTKKRVPMELLGRLNEDREFHRPDFVSVQDTVKPGVLLAEFDEYFNRVIELANMLKPYRHV